MKKTMQKESYSVKQVLRFLIPSLIGAFCFLCPIPCQDGSLTIPISYIISGINGFFGGNLVYSAAAVILCSAVFAVITAVFKPKFILERPILNNVFNVKWYWIVARVLGAAFVLMVMTQKGPEFIISGDTGTFVLYDLLAGILTIAIVAGCLLPLLVEFGLMEFVGTLLGKVCRTLFRIPGRAAVDCLSSWLGDTTIAVLLTSQQLESGFYTRREAATIATSFSAVSISFALIVISEVGMMDMFFPFYGIVGLIGILCAVIVPRIPPLSRIPDTYMVESTYPGEERPEGMGLLEMAWQSALHRANNNGYTVKKYIYDSLKNVLSVLISLSAMVMAVGTLALAVAYYTPVLTYLGYPFKFLLELLQVPEAATASTTVIAGFADMFIPAMIAGSSIASPYTRFLVAVVSMTQLIFISENGSMILSTRIPVNLLQLFIIFLERTIISIIAASLLIRLFLPGLLA